MNIALLREAADKVRDTFQDPQPYCALVLGSGWGEVAMAFRTKESMSYAEIPCMGRTETKGHSGRLILAETAGFDVLIFQGRRHWYEGAGWEPVALPVFLSLAFGASAIILTNAAGSMRSDLNPGDLMVIDDHINAMGSNPLVGKHDPVWGPRFPDQTQVYDKSLRELLDESAHRLGRKLPHGVYIATSGPGYETPSEIAAFRVMGADAVGMSTVPEAILAHSAGLRVAGISCITNMAAGISTGSLSHDEVISEARRIQPLMKTLLAEFFGLLPVPKGRKAKD